MQNEKQLLRKKLKEMRSTLNVSELSFSICYNIKNWDCYKNARNVMIFYPIGSEISLLSLLDDDKNFYFPKVDGENLFPVMYNSSNGFLQGAFGIKEPVGECSTDLSKIDIVFVPALAVDNNGYRLGYGKGFYDRFLPTLKNAVTVVPIAQQLVMDKIPLELHDKKTEYLITQNSVFKTSILGC